jgi:hypothetical protein
MAAVTQSKLSIPVADGLKTINYRLAYLISVNVGVGEQFANEYGIESDWNDNGEAIPVDSGEFLNWLAENVKR